MNLQLAKLDQTKTFSFDTGKCSKFALKSSHLVALLFSSPLMRLASGFILHLCAIHCFVSDRETPRDAAPHPLHESSCTRRPPGSGAQEMEGEMYLRPGSQQVCRDLHTEQVYGGCSKCKTQDSCSERKFDPSILVQTGSTQAGFGTRRPLRLGNR